MLLTSTLILLATLLSALPTSSAHLGFDVSQALSSSDAACMRSKGFRRAMTRATLCSSGTLDARLHANLRALHDGHFDDVGVYLFPCITGDHCPSLEEQVAVVVKALVAANASTTTTTLWLDIEAGSTCPWHAAASDNERALRELVTAARRHFHRVGVYSSMHNWLSIFKRSSFSFDALKDLPLWYAHYDNEPHFSDFVAFGGWTKPAMKQFADSGNECAVRFDINYYE